MLAFLTAVEPEDERRDGPGRRRRLDEPVEERAAAGLVDGDVARVLREVHVGRLPRELPDPVALLVGRGGGGRQ